MSVSVTDYTSKGKELIHVQKQVSRDGRKSDAFFFHFFIIKFAIILSKETFPIMQNKLALERLMVFINCKVVIY